MLKRAFPLVLTAVLGSTGCDSDLAREILAPPLPEASQARILPMHPDVPQECPLCLVPPTVLTRATQAPERTVIAFAAGEGQKGELVLVAPDPMRTTLWVRLNGGTLLLPSDLPRSGVQEVRIPVVLSAHNHLEVRLSAKPGSSVVFWLEAEAEPQEPAARVVAIPTGLTHAPALASDGSDLAILALTHPETGAFRGAALHRAGTARPLLVRSDPSGIPGVVFLGGGAAYLDGWDTSSGVPTVRVTIPGGGSLTSMSTTVELPSFFAAVMNGILTSVPVPEPGGAISSDRLRGLSTGELLAAQAAVCSLERAGALTAEWGACDPALSEGLALFWTEWTEALGFAPFLGSATAPLEELGCEGEACLLRFAERVESTILELTPRRMLVTGGDGQVGAAGSTLSAPVRILLTNEADTPLPGFLLHLDVISGGGTVPENGGSTALLATDAMGTAETPWVLGNEVGNQILRASTSAFPDLVVEITATAEEPAPTVTFRLTAAVVAPTAAMTAVCAAEFGPSFAIADWNDVAAALSSGRTRLEIMGDGVAMILNNGVGAFTPMFQFTTHHHTISTLGAGYPILGNLGPDLFWLSEDTSSHPVLCMG